MFRLRPEKGPLCRFSDAIPGQESGCCALTEAAVPATRSKCYQNCPLVTCLLVMDQVCPSRRVV
jgi:hypothetical protein